MFINRYLFFALFCSLVAGVSFAVELTGTVSVNETSDTADKAKTLAFKSARRDVIARELRAYANPVQLDAAIKNSSDEDLMNIISSSSLDSEKLSDTTYSANISFVIDGDAARVWMDKNSVQHWLPSSDAPVAPVAVNAVVVNAVLLQPMADWANLNAVSRGSRVEFMPTKFVGNNVYFTVAEKDISRFLSVLRSNGWHVQSLDNGYKIWK